MIMSKDGIKSSILQFVSQRPGCTPIELVCGIAFGENFAVDVPVLLETLVDEGSLIEVEYVLPTMDYRTKSILFSKGSEIEIVKEANKIIVFGSGDNEVGGKELPLGTKITINKGL
jgi:hypothetical protein